MPHPLKGNGFLKDGPFLFDKFSMRILALWPLLFIFLSFLGTSQASLHSHWKEKSVFFGVNQAWESEKYETVLVTLVARERYRPFQNADFPEAKYAEQLTKLREIGLAPIGVKNWKVESLNIEKLSGQKILVKVKGTYERKKGVVHFYEWQVFDEHLYQQVNLVEQADAPEKIPKKEVKSVLKGALKL